MYLFNTYLNSPWFLLLALVLLPVALARKPRTIVLKTVHSSLLKGLKRMSVIRAALPTVIFMLGMSCLIWAMAQPQIISAMEQMYWVLRHIGLVCDMSGSMDEGVTDEDTQFAKEQIAKAATNQQSNSSNNTNQAVAGPTPAAFSKARLLELAINTKLLPLVKGDQVFACAFNDKVKFLDVPTTDLDELALHIHIVPDGSTNFAGLGMNIDGQPVGGIEGGIKCLMTVSALDETRILIIITDGDDSIPDKDPGKEFSTLEQHLHDQHIHFYVMGIGQSWITQGWEKTLDLARLAMSPKVNGTIIRVGKREEMAPVWQRLLLSKPDNP